MSFKGWRFTLAIVDPSKGTALPTLTQEGKERPSSKVKLHLGCGEKYLAGWLNVDSSQNVRADRHFDLNHQPWPFVDNSVDEILMDNVLEHLDDVLGAMREIHRILKQGGSAKIIVPYAHSQGAYWDPTHKHFFLPETFNYFTPEGPPYTRLGFKASVGLTCLHEKVRHKIRNLLPFRRLLTLFVRNMYDCVEATMTKL